MSGKMSLSSKIEDFVSGLNESFRLSDIYRKFPNEKKTTIRGRIYRELIGRGVITRISDGLYEFAGNDGQSGLVVQGNARDLSSIQDSSISLIIADHPYKIQTGRNRDFTKGYQASLFEYQQDDFNEKSRVLCEGCFLVEFLPEMKDGNADYISNIIQMAKGAGLRLYARVPWYKAEVRNGKLIDHSANVGRKGVMEDIYIFSKGAPRKLRMRNQGGVIRSESGAKSILPAVFMEKPLLRSEKSHQSAKPPQLIRKLIDLFTLEMEVVLDQFAGSFVAFWEAIGMKRKAIAIELCQEYIDTNFLDLQTEEAA
ncbi:DNA methyltransferase [Bdellovibrio sp. BCCA]|uniref:DNA methyltransferase n=1 Tax=Bdellovibrio sp. BCCA TaxID=3136281 RepID=UPI0030F1BEDC